MDMINSLPWWLKWITGIIIGNIIFTIFFIRSETRMQIFHKNPVYKKSKAIGQTILLYFFYNLIMAIPLLLFIPAFGVFTGTVNPLLLIIILPLLIVTMFGSIAGMLNRRQETGDS